MSLFNVDFNVKQIFILNYFFFGWKIDGCFGDWPKAEGLNGSPNELKTFPF
jgi:hypothetical protein